MSFKKIAPGPAVLIAFVLLASCTGRGKAPAVKPNVGGQASAPPGIAWQTIALLETGDNPIWFELGAESLRVIESPGAASLAPFIPWPHCRFIAGMWIWESFIAMAVNSDGFLILGPGRDSSEVAVYRAGVARLWEHYTIGSFFEWESKPAVLLYRNDFFRDPSVPSPRPQVHVLDKYSPMPLGASLPALEKFPSDAAWETEELRYGPDGFWYYRMKEKETEKADSAYFRAANLREAGSSISMVEWMNSDRPEGPEAAPPSLALILEQAAVSDRNAFPLALTIASDFEGPRLFGLSGISADEPALLYACVLDDFALAITPDGLGYCSAGIGVRSFALPALPDGFVYTGAACLGNALAASWEEQQEAGIGAAGFLVMAFKR